MSEMIERIQDAIASVQLFSRYNDWTSDRVEGLPVEICRYGKDGEEHIVVVARFPQYIGEGPALAEVVNRERAVAVLHAMREPTFDMLESSAKSRRPLKSIAANSLATWRTMIDAALTTGERTEG